MADNDPEVEMVDSISIDGSSSGGATVGNDPIVSEWEVEMNGIVLSNSYSVVISTDHI